MRKATDRFSAIISLAASSVIGATEVRIVWIRLGGCIIVRGPVINYLAYESWGAICIMVTDLPFSRFGGIKSSYIIDLGYD